jgi:uncharacterized protein (TIGR02145 family)
MKNIFGISGLILLALFIQYCKEKPTPPVLTTTAVSAISYTTATSGGEVTNEGGDQVTSRGICWNTVSDPTTSNNKTTENGGLGAFTSNLTQLTPNTTYFVRAYATNSAGTGYGDPVTFTTSQVAVPVLTTTAISAITQTSAVSGGNITDDKGSSVTARGVCLGTVANPTTANSKTSDGTGKGIFTSSIIGLTGNTTYYVRAYATNSAGTEYGNQVVFTTSPLIPTISTSATSSITQTTAISGGNVTADGGATVTARGICFSTTAAPTITSTIVAATGTTGAFTSNITGLTANTTYYVRAFATNSAGTAYGNEVVFTTSLPLPTITNFSSVTKNYGDVSFTLTQPTSNSAGLFTYSSGNTGIVTISGSTVTIVGAGTTIITATQSATSSYASGSITANITVNALLPALSTTSITNTSATATTSGGNITNDGGAIISMRGLCWSTSQNATTSDSKTLAGTGSGVFTSSITGLAANTTYYVRAYAINSAGTSYGNELIIRTSTGSVTDIDGNSYFTVTIGTQVWFRENLKTTKYNDGTSIPLVTDITSWASLSGPAYCWNNNDPAAYKATYGALYNWFALDVLTNGNKNVCPTGWHVSSDADWTTLTTFLGGENIAAGKLKEEGIINWYWPNTSATNESGFTALPGGYRSYNVSYNSQTMVGFWWTSTESSSTEGWYRDMNYTNSVVRRGGGVGTSKKNGLSIRCVKN